MPPPKSRSSYSSAATIFRTWFTSGPPAARTADPSRGSRARRVDRADGRTEPWCRRSPAAPARQLRRLARRSFCSQGPHHRPIALRAEAGRYDQASLLLLEGLVGQASIALESARLVDLHDDGRRTWQEVVDAISPAICIVDRSGRIRRANRAFADLVNAPPASLIGRPWHAFVPPEWTSDLERALDEQGVGREVDLRTGDQTYAVTAVPITSTDRSTLVLLFDDQTERRRLQDQLIQSEKLSAIGQLIAGIAHDLNNPLASVVGFADFLREVPDVPPALREPLAVIQEEAERASNIVKNLLGFARKQEHQRRPTSLATLLDNTLLLLRNQLMAHRVEAHIEVEADLPMPHIDSNQIQQVFVNLIHNAAQAIASSGRPGTIIVRARPWLDGVAVDVIDDGPGMSESLASQVFEPFFTTKPEGEGTGLGLSISQGIVSEHGGRILLATEEGRGSTFTVQLPLATRPSAPTTRCSRRHAIAPPSGARGRRRAAHPPLHARDTRGVGSRPVVARGRAGGTRVG